MAQKKEKPASALGRLGGNATLKKHGKKHYKAMAKKRWHSENKGRKK